jgi:chromate transporter
VIVNLALFFAYHVLWPQGFGASFASAWAGIDWVAVGIALVAALALFRYKRSVLQVIAGAAMLGLAVKILF